MPNRLQILFSLASVASAWACSGESTEDRGPGPVIERDTVGDVEVVTIVSGSVWGAPATVAEEMSIGALEGAEELTFGRIMEMVPDDAGGIYVFDMRVPILRYYDADGSFVRNVGAEGQGPGEYGDAALGLAIRSDGRLLMRDARNGRLNVYEPNGEPSDSWRVTSGLFTSQAMILDDRDHVYLKILLGEIQEDEAWPIGLLHLDDGGQIIDSIPPPAVAEPPPYGDGRFLPGVVWTMGSRGEMIVGASDRYEFEIRRRAGRVLRVRRAWEPVSLHSEEKEQWQDVLDWQWEQQRQFMRSEFDPVPDEKPAYRGLFAGTDGTIWVQLHVDAEYVESTTDPDPERPPPIEWREPTVFDVFEPDGTYLGQVRVPERTRISVFSGSTLWGVRRGDFDEEYVVRLRVEPPR